MHMPGIQPEDHGMLDKAKFGSRDARCLSRLGKRKNSMASIGLDVWELRLHWNVHLVLCNPLAC